jgi:hypothetical protein
VVRAYQKNGGQECSPRAIRAAANGNLRVNPSP